MIGAGEGRIDGNIYQYCSPVRMVRTKDEVVRIPSGMPGSSTVRHVFRKGTTTRETVCGPARGTKHGARVAWFGETLDHYTRHCGGLYRCDVGEAVLKQNDEIAWSDRAWALFKRSFFTFVSTRPVRQYEPSDLLFKM